MWILAAYAYSLASHIVVLLVLHTWLHYFDFTECGQVKEHRCRLNRQDFLNNLEGRLASGYHSAYRFKWSFNANSYDVLAPALYSLPLWKLDSLTLLMLVVDTNTICIMGFLLSTKCYVACLVEAFMSCLCRTPRTCYQARSKSIRINERSL